MKPTQLMLDAAYEAALVSTTEQLARNGSSVNYRVVMEAALTEALAVMPKPEEPKPVVPEVAYSVSHTFDGARWGGVSGPYPKLSQALQQNGDDTNHYICKHELDGTVSPLYRWHVGYNKWVRFTS
jgi:hypothetical protein